MIAVVIEVDGTARRLDWHGLEDLQAAVGGYIESIPLGEDVGYLNEEGKLQGLEVNLTATEIAHRLGGIFPYDVVVGALVIVGPTDAEGYDTGAPEWALALVGASA